METHASFIQQKTDDEWDILFEELVATDHRVDHMKILHEIEESNVILMANLEKKIQPEVIKDYRICPKCDIHCRIYEHSLVCEKCGLERDWLNSDIDTYSITIGQNYNTAQNSYISFNIIGNGAYCYQRSFLKTCASYMTYRNMNNKKEITNIIYQYEGNKPPANVISASAELFDQVVASGRVFRKNGKRGIMAACLYYACLMNNVARTPRDIAIIMATEERFLSHGDRILQELNELKIIEIPTNYEPIDDYLNQYFPLLGIPEKYKAFVSELIKRAEKKHLHVRHECRTTTKCIGAIYLLTQRIKELRHLKKEDIARECNNISKNTFLKYYKLLMSNHKLLKKSFKRHGIPMPKSWK